MTKPQTDRLGADELTSFIRAIADEPRLTTVMTLADEMRMTASRSARPADDACLLAEQIRHGDGVSSIAAIHALGAVAHPLADRALLELLDDATEPFAAHAAWALADRVPTPETITALVRTVAAGGFAAMLAERTLVGWSRIDPRPTIAAVHQLQVFDATERSRLHLLLRAVPTLSSSAARRSYDHLRRSSASDGIVVIQPYLHAHIDRDGSGLGAGDAGGVASLLRTLGSALADLDDIADVITITRRHGRPTEVEERCEQLAPRHHVERIDVGPGGAMTAREAWAYRSQIEREFVAIGQALMGRRVLWHLRTADVGTLAAAAAARTLGQPIVFTNTPDPAAVIDTLQDCGRLDRARFAVDDAAEQHWCRVRLAQCLTTHADRLIRPPRSADETDSSDRATVVPEGVEITEIDRAWQRLATTGTADVTRRIIHSLPGERRHLPWLLTVGRLHPSKGQHRIVEAVMGDERLRRLVNIVVVGGDVDHPSADEQSAMELIHQAARDAPVGLVTLTGRLAPAAISDLMARTVERGGIYVCASDREEFGLALIEALVAGAAVIAPCRGGASTYLSEGELGTLCDTTSPASLRAAITHTLTMADDQSRATRARTMVRSTLSVQRMAARLLHVYRDVLTSPVKA